jgi:glycine oxidase
VIVVGGGLIGCAIAFRLAQQKLRVRVFDRGQPGCEASSAGAGMIAPQGETVEPDGFYQLCAASRDLYPRFATEIEEISDQTVNLRRDGTLMIALDESERMELNTIYDGQTRAGLPIERLSASEVRREIPQVSENVQAGLLVRGDHWVDNEALVQALETACRKCGVVFHPNTAVSRFNLDGRKVGSIETGDQARHQAGMFVLAAGAWSGELASSLDLRLPVVPCRGQMMEFDGADGFPLALRASHCYLVPRSGGRLAAGSNMEYAGYQKSVTGEGLLTVLAGATRMAPSVKELRFRRAWAGLRPDTGDHRPILGLGKFENLIFATGHFRNGILLTPVTAKLISELIATGSSSIPIDAYSPRRFAG